MSFLESVIGSIFLEYIGAGVIWTFQTLINLVKGKKAASFSVTLNGRKKDSQYDSFLEGFKNIIVGLITLIILIACLVYLSR